MRGLPPFKEQTSVRIFGIDAKAKGLSFQIGKGSFESKLVVGEDEVSTIDRSDDGPTKNVPVVVPIGGNFLQVECNVTGFTGVLFGFFDDVKGGGTATPLEEIEEIVVIHGLL
jgi:hypothetical protein